MEKKRTGGNESATRLAAQLMPLPAIVAFILGLSDAVQRTATRKTSYEPTAEQKQHLAPQRSVFASVERKLATKLAAAEAATVRLEVEQSGLAKIAGSGVIVSPSGLVLTAGHNLETAKGKVTVFLSDGRKREAEVLGFDHDADTGVLQLLNESAESYDYVEIRNDTQLEPGTWCFALGHPGGHDEGRGVVLRVGRVVATSAPVVRTTCKLASGDSGGPLFDLQGRVAAIHSRITEDITENFHVRTPTFITQWSSLAPSATAPAIAEQNHSDFATTHTKNTVPVSAIVQAALDSQDIQSEKAEEAFKIAVARARAATVSIEDASRSKRLCLGTAIAPAIVVTKASTVSETAELQVKFANGTISAATLVPGKHTEDLAYLRLSIPAPSYLRPEKGNHNATLIQRGRLVVTPLPHSDSPLGFESGTIAAETRKIARAKGLLGIRLAGDSGAQGCKIESIFPGSEASETGLFSGDTILSIGGNPVSSRAQVQNAIATYYPGETVAIRVLREGKKFLVHPRITSKHKIDTTGLDPHFERAAAIDGPTSWRQTGFTKATQHDIALHPNQMGTPLLDLKGRFIALSIARVDRVTTLALPASAIQQPSR